MRRACRPASAPGQWSNRIWLRPERFLPYSIRFAPRRPPRANGVPSADPVGATILTLGRIILVRQNLLEVATWSLSFVSFTCLSRMCRRGISIFRKTIGFYAHGFVHRRLTCSSIPAILAWTARGRWRTCISPPNGSSVLPQKASVFQAITMWATVSRSCRRNR